jgi:molybdopterin molybdotransferase
MTAPKTLREASCADDYDPNSIPVERARALIRDYLEPVTAVERVHIRQALGRTLAADVVSPIDVPGHDNSAMDGWAVRFADFAPGATTTLRRIGESCAGRPCPARPCASSRAPSCRAAPTPSSCRSAPRSAAGRS